MALSNYTELQASVLDWLNRDDLAAKVPDFIRLAEAKFNRKLRLREQLVRVLTTVGDCGETALPDDWLESKDVWLENGDDDAQLEVVAYDDLLNIRRTEAPGTPRAYALQGTTLALAPLNGGSNEVKLAYYRTIPPLASNTTNWLLLKAPDAYLYGACLQAAPYLRDAEQLAVWNAGLTQTLDELVEADKQAQHSGSPLRMRSRKSFG
jgi:hypothetical protein